MEQKTEDKAKNQRLIKDTIVTCCCVMAFLIIIIGQAVNK